MKTVWPASSNQPANKRDMDNIYRIVELLRLKEAGELDVNLSADDVQGFVGRSKFLDIPNFDFIHCIPTEYMHGVCLGVMKRLLEVTFSVGEKRVRVTTRKLSSPFLYNQLMREIKVPREFSRRARQLDLSVLKAQELRNILISVSYTHLTLPTTPYV